MFQQVDEAARNIYYLRKFINEEKKKGVGLYHFLINCFDTTLVYIYYRKYIGFFAIMLIANCLNNWHNSK